MSSAIAAIEKHGALLVYPIENRPEPLSLWRVFHPRTPMRWDWDETGDARVGDLWRLREELARSRKVVHSKWYRGRATFFSRDLFVALVATYRAIRPLREGLDADALDILGVLESDSPRSTKELRAAAGLTGKLFERTYRRALDQLFARTLIVGFGEVDDGAFPSLAIGATSTLFEDLWDEAAVLDPAVATSRIARHFAPGAPFAKQHAKALQTIATSRGASALPAHADARAAVDREGDDHGAPEEPRRFDALPDREPEERVSHQLGVPRQRAR